MNLKPITPRLTASSQSLPLGLAAIQAEGAAQIATRPRGPELAADGARMRDPGTGKRP